MPGITGIISLKDADQNRADLSKMVEALHHEAFYSSGSFIDESQGLYVGWTCVEGSYSDPMPIWNESRTATLFFYGENFDRREDVRGTGTGANSDAKFVLGLYEHKGLDFLGYLNGCFHGLLADFEQSRIILFNDRLGFQRLYVHDGEDAFIFSSEAKSILSVRPKFRAFDDRSLGEYFVCGCALEDRTLFKDVHVLPSGSAYLFGRGRLSKRERYFLPSRWESQPLMDGDEAYQRLTEILPSVVNRYVSSDRRTGISLTGGLDTRLIMAHIQAERSEVPCYTFGGMYRESYDVKLARKVAALCGHSHRVIFLPRDLFDDYARLAEEAVSISDGSLGAEGAYEIYFNRLARQIAPVRVTGNYGSELLRNHAVFSWAYPLEGLINPEYARYLTLAAETFKAISDCHDLTFRLFRQAPWLGFGRMAVEQSQVVVRNPFLDYELLELMYRVPRPLRTGSDLEISLIHSADPKLLVIPTDRAERHRFMKKTPFWSRAWMEFILKADNCYKSYMPQWLEQIHYWLGPLQPEKYIIGRNRFSYPRIWYRRELASYVRDIILDPRTLRRGYLNGAFVEQMLTRHQKGDRNYANQIEQVLTLELIQKLFFGPGH